MCFDRVKFSVCRVWACGCSSSVVNGAVRAVPAAPARIPKSKPPKVHLSSHRALVYALHDTQRPVGLPQRVDHQVLDALDLAWTVALEGDVRKIALDDCVGWLNWMIVLDARSAVMADGKEGER